MALGTGINISAQERLDKLADECDYFGLREELERSSGELPRQDLLYWTSICSGIFDDCGRSLEAADDYLKEFSGSAPAENIVEIYKNKGDILMRLYRYREAAEVYSLILEKHPEVPDDKEKANIGNNLMLCMSLEHVPPQKTRATGGNSIPYSYNYLNHIMVPVSSGGQKEEFIFDTGANISTIAESQAEAMGMEIIETAIEVGTSTDIKIKMKLAVAASLSVGDMEFENVVFLTAPDELLSFPEIGLEIKGIIGFPVIYAMREIRIGHDRITIPPTPTDRGLRNICLEGLMPVVYAHIGNERHVFTLDTGANKSELSHRYYEKHKEHIDGTYTPLSNRRGGGGGIVDSEIYELPDLTLEIGNRNIGLSKISVSTQPFEFNKDKDGNLGQDVLRHFPVMVLSFEHMFLDFDAEE